MLSFAFSNPPSTAVLNQLLLTPSHARLRYWSAIVLYLMILVIGSIPNARKDIGEVASGLVLHSCAYAGLTFLLFTGGRGGVAARAVKAVLTIALMGALDEYVQSFFPYRHGAVSDWLVDCAAAVAMAAAMALLWSRHPARPAV
jgi:VanZ family protein